MLFATFVWSKKWWEEITWFTTESRSVSIPKSTTRRNNEMHVIIVFFLIIIDERLEPVLCFVLVLVTRKDLLNYLGSYLLLDYYITLLCLHTGGVSEPSLCSFPQSEKLWNSWTTGKSGGSTKITPRVQWQGIKDVTEKPEQHVETCRPQWRSGFRLKASGDGK